MIELVDSRPRLQKEVTYCRSSPTTTPEEAGIVSSSSIMFVLANMALLARACALAATWIRADAVCCALQGRAMS